MLWCCLSLILSMFDWTSRLQHQWNSVFDLKLNLLYSYDHSMFMKNHWKLLDENSRKFSFKNFNRSRIPFNWSNVPFSIDRTGIESRSSQPETLWWISSIFRPIKNSLQSIEFAFLIDRIGMESRSSHPERLVRFSS